MAIHFKISIPTPSKSRAKRPSLKIAGEKVFQSSSRLIGRIASLLSSSVSFLFCRNLGSFKTNRPSLSIGGHCFIFPDAICFQCLAASFFPRLRCWPSFEWKQVDRKSLTSPSPVRQEVERRKAAQDLNDVLLSKAHECKANSRGQPSRNPPLSSPQAAKKQRTSRSRPSAGATLSIRCKPIRSQLEHKVLDWNSKRTKRPPADKVSFFAPSTDSSAARFFFVYG